MESDGSEAPRCGCGQYPDVCRRYGHALPGALPEPDETAEAVDHRSEAVDLIYRRLDGGGFGTTSKDCIKAVLHAAEQEFDAVFGPDLIVCLDCQGRAIPLCDASGHGLVTLADLMESYSNA